MKRHTARAITTRYKGYAFRSRLEARWAVFFDHLGIRWEYEPEGFELGNGLRYLPDFWLPDWGLWVEIKPDCPDAVSREKALRLAENHHAVIILCGMPRAEYHNDNVFYGWDRGESGGGLMPDRAAGGFADIDGQLRLLVEGSSRKSYYAREDSKDELPTFDSATHGKDRVVWDRIGDAVDAARSARFEFGAEGGL